MASTQSRQHRPEKDTPILSQSVSDLLAQLLSHTPEPSC